jgi:hypothetical protein
MDSCGIFLVVFGIGALLIIPFALRAKEQHDTKLTILREAYAGAKLIGEPGKITAAAQAIVDEVKRSNPLGLATIADEIYRDMLKLLKAHPECKPFALEMGRLAYGSKRKDRSPTVYDEQAILNDINAHL